MNSNRDIFLKNIREEKQKNEFGNHEKQN